MLEVYVLGADYLTSLLASGGFSAKMVFNASGAIIFPTAEEHRDQKGPGLSYEDESQGNALAAMLSAGKMEIRGHNKFSPEQVANLVANLLVQPELSVMKGWQVIYRGQPLLRLN
jgi:hypothetical protein